MKRKKEIKILKKCQKVMWENQYPGYPFQKSIIIDLEQNSAWLDWLGKKQPLDKALMELNSLLMYRVITADNTNKQTWLIDQHLEPYQEYLKYGYDNFTIDDYNVCRFYFSLMSAIYNRKKSDNKVYIFALIDEDCDYVDVNVFKSLSEIESYYNNYFNFGLRT